jgi:hypothetical protein
MLCIIIRNFVTIPYIRLINCRRNYQVQDSEGTRPQIQKYRREKEICKGTN